jgi:hypothetical protein
VELVDQRQFAGVGDQHPVLADEAIDRGRLRRCSVLRLGDADRGHLEIILALSERGYLVPHTANLEILECKGIFDLELFGV